MIKKTIITLCIILFSINVNAIDLVHTNTDRTEKLFTNLELVNIFTRKQLYWKNGHKINVFIKKISSIEHSVFVTEFLGLTPYRFKKRLERATYSGEASPLKEVKTDLDMSVAIATHQYSIGYLDEAHAIINWGGDIIIVDPDDIEYLDIN